MSSIVVAQYPFRLMTSQPAAMIFFRASSLYSGTTLGIFIRMVWSDP